MTIIMDNRAGRLRLLAGKLLKNLGLLTAGLAWVFLGQPPPALAAAGYVAVACLKRNADQCGVINEKGDWVVAPGFDRISDFAPNGLAVAFKRQRPGLINIRGEWVIQPGFDQVGAEWSAGRLKVGRSDRRTGWRYGLADESGHLLVDTVFREIQTFGPNRLAGACDQEAGCGFIDAKGAWVVPPIFEEVDQFAENGLAPARRQGEDLWGYINVAGKFVIPPAFDEAYPFDGDRAKVFSAGRYSLINSKGQAVGPHKFASLGDFEPGGLTPAQKEVDGLFGLVNRGGAWVVPPRFDRVFSFNGGKLAPAQKDGLYGFINRSGQWVIKPSFGNVDDFESRGRRAPAEQSGAWGLIDSEGRWVVEPDHLLLLNAGLGGFQGPVQVFAENGRWGLMDENGRWILEPILTATPYFAANGLSEAKVGELYGFIDRFGNWVVEPAFRQVGIFRPVPEVPPAMARAAADRAEVTRLKVKAPPAAPQARPTRPKAAEPEGPPPSSRQPRGAARAKKKEAVSSPARRVTRPEPRPTRLIVPDKPPKPAAAVPPAPREKRPNTEAVQTAPGAPGYIPPEEVRARPTRTAAPKRTTAPAPAEPRQPPPPQPEIPEITQAAPEAES